MTIYFLTTKLNILKGGGSNLALDLRARNLIKAGHKVAIITAFSSKNRLKSTPYKVHEEEMKSSHARQNLPEIVAILKKYEVDADVFIVDGHFFLWGATEYKKQGGKTPVIADLFSYLESWNKFQDQSHWGNIKRSLGLLRQRLWEKKKAEEAGRLISAFLYTSPAVRHLFERFKWPAHKFFLIPPAAEIDPGRSRKPNSNRLLFVGRLVRYKGVDTLLRAVKKLKLPYRLDIVGDGQHGDAWKKLAKKLGLKEHVKFHPFSDWDKLKSFYRDAQLLIHPTRDPEPFGMTIVESLSCGTPVISSKGSGSEWVAGAAGLTFKPNSAKDLKVQIERFLADKDLQEKMQKEAVKRAKTFNHSEWTPKLIQVLQKVVKKG